MKNLRRFFYFFSVMALVFSCANPDYESSGIDLTTDEEARNHVYEQILDNEKLFNEFMNEMMQHGQSMQWMMNNGNMMQYMYDAQNMHTMMQQNPDLRNHMMQEWNELMNQDTSYYNQMNHMMEQGHMGMNGMR